MKGLRVFAEGTEIGKSDHERRKPFVDNELRCYLCLEKSTAFWLETPMLSESRLLLDMLLEKLRDQLRCFGRKLMAAW